MRECEKDVYRGQRNGDNIIIIENGFCGKFGKRCWGPIYHRSLYKFHKQTTTAALPLKISNVCFLFVNSQNGVVSVMMFDISRRRV